jgi:hypothetical protein
MLERNYDFLSRNLIEFLDFDSFIITYLYIRINTHFSLEVSTLEVDSLAYKWVAKSQVFQLLRKLVLSVFFPLGSIRSQELEKINYLKVHESQ